MNYAETFQQMLIDLLPEGVFKKDADVLHADLLLAAAEVLAEGQEAVDQLDKERFPHTAEEDLEEWEAFFELDRDPLATDDERRETLHGRARAAMATRPAEIRSMLAPLLNPEYQFRDPCDDSAISWRYEQLPGNGSISEGSNGLTLAVPASADGSWGSGTRSGPLAALDLVDRKDAVWMEAKVTAFGGAQDTAGGIVLYENDGDVYLLGPWDQGGTTLIRAMKMEDGSAPTQVGSATPPSLPYWLQIYRADGKVSFLYGLALDAMTSMVSIEESTIGPRKVGAFAYNTGSLLDSSISLKPVQWKHKDPANNVELIESSLANVPDDYKEALFIAFVHRHPEDTGSYNIKEAQRLMDRCKKGHTLILVGESDQFLFGDAYSLFGRDVFG